MNDNQKIGITDGDDSQELQPSFITVDWNGEGLPPVGVECEWIGGGVNHGDWGLVIVRAYNNEFAWIEKLRDNSMSTVRNPAHFRKQETPEQREDRERMEAAYDLYLLAQNEIEGDVIDYSDFVKESRQMRAALSIVDKTGYRK